jgi:hypothetical protein
MRTQIYHLKLIDGKELHAVSRNTLYNDIKEYIKANDKVKESWYYPTKNQIDNIFYNRVKKPNLFFIDSFSWCYADDLFKCDVRETRENGKKYTDKYIRTQKNNYIKKQLDELQKQNLQIDMSVFNSILVCEYVHN